MFPPKEGFDLSPGYATVIGISGKERIKLPDPYTECSNINREAENLLNIVNQKLEDPERILNSELQGEYRTVECRSECLQRYILQSCNCLDSKEKNPFFAKHLLCGFLGDNVKLLYQPTNDTYFDQCLDNNKTLLECLKPLEKLMRDLKCVKKVKEWHPDYDCDCPSPCHLIKYDLDFGFSHWPSPGPEVDIAYNKIVLERVIPRFRKFNNSASRAIVEYFSEWKKRRKILHNFARVTVYPQSLTVEKIEEVAAYTALHLISDIGE